MIRFTKPSSIQFIWCFQRFRKFKYIYIRQKNQFGGDRPRMPGRTQSMGAELGNSPCELHHNRQLCSWVSFREPSILHPKISILIPLTPNSTSKLIHLITNIKRHLNEQQTSDYNTNSSQNHHLAHFHQKPPFSYFLFKLQKQPHQFQPNNI